MEEERFEDVDIFSKIESLIGFVGLGSQTDSVLWQWIRRGFSSECG